MFKYISILILITLLYNTPFQKIELKDIDHITILDHENINYEFVTTKDYKIEFDNFEYKLYATGDISFSEFARTKCQRKYKRFSKKSVKIEQEIYQTNDTILENKLLEYSDNFYNQRKKEYKEYISKLKPKYIHKVNERKILELVNIINSSPVSFQEFHKSKYSKKNSIMEEIDSMMIRQRFEFLDNFSYYPTIDFQVITDSDTIIYYTNSQHNPPMPWNIIIKGKEIKTYDDRINKALYKILPSKPNLNRSRLNESIDSLFIKFEKELE